MKSYTTVYYLNKRLVSKKDIPSDAKLIRTEKTTAKWGGMDHYVREKYYETLNSKK